MKPEVKSAIWKTGVLTGAICTVIVWIFAALEGTAGPDMTLKQLVMWLAILPFAMIWFTICATIYAKIKGDW